MFVYHDIEINNICIVATKVGTSSEKTTQKLICAYIPFFRGGNNNRAYANIATIDGIRGVIYSNGSPNLIIWDFNVQLPKSYSYH